MEVMKQVYEAEHIENQAKILNDEVKEEQRLNGGMSQSQKF